jgi:hypothetical protein
MSDADVLIGSLGDLANMAGMPSEPTIKKMIDADPAFPVLSRGTNGRAWEFDLKVAWEYIRQCQERDEANARAHREAVAQLGFDLLGEGALVDDVQVLTLSPQEQNAAMNAEYLRTKLAEKRGSLVAVREIAAGLSEDLVFISDFGRGFSGRCAKRATFSREQMNVIDQVMDEFLGGIADRFEELGKNVAASSDVEADAAAEVPLLS